MAKQIQLRRGSTAAHNNFTGAEGEVTVDTTAHTLRVHDGATPGGIPLARASDISGANTPLKSPNYTTGQTLTNNQIYFADNNYIAICSNGAGSDGILQISSYANMSSPRTIAEVFITTTGQIYFRIPAFIPKGYYFRFSGFDTVQIFKA